MAESHSDSELCLGTRSNIHDLTSKPKFIIDCREKEKEQPFHNIKKKDNTLISFHVEYHNDFDNDDEYLPPQHPKRKGKKRSVKIDENHWKFWKKKLPKNIEYCDEEIKHFMRQTKEKRETLISTENSIQKHTSGTIPPRFKFLELTDMDTCIKQMIIHKIDEWYSMEPTQSEKGKLDRWIDCIQRVPFGKYAPSIKQIITKQQLKPITYLKQVKDGMDNVVFAHEEAKEQMIELLAADFASSTSGIASGCCFGLQGPAGNGKTTLIKEGIAKSLKRPFCLIALGGAKDSSTFVGHDYTYEGSSYGRILQALIMTKVMNPIIYFDELDKLSEDIRGEEISNLLCHLVDPSQNTLFEDKYLSGIPINLSNVMFIFSFNDGTKIHPILKNRIEIIKTEGLKEKDKNTIVRNYIIPEVRRNLPSIPELNWTDEVINHIIRYFTPKHDKGVRNLKRAIYSIYRKFNLHMMANEQKDESITLFTKSIKLHKNKHGSYEVTKEMIEEYLKSKKDECNLSLYT